MLLKLLFPIQKDLPGKTRSVLIIFSFFLPILIWSAVSYIPFIWHPYIEITNPGDSLYFEKGQLVKLDIFEKEKKRLGMSSDLSVTGKRANPVYLPPPHKVLSAIYTSFITEPRRPGDPWLHQSLWHSIKIVFWGFFISSIIGVPLGIMSGIFCFVSRLTEPFVEFFRYLPAPVFGALAVAVLGINDSPKIAIIFIGTFFQQVLIIANTTRQLPPPLLEAAQTLGAKGFTLIRKVVLPAIAPKVFMDMRILLGWAWTYLIVAEIVGTSTGITWFINQQAKYRIYENVYAAIILIGIIGFGTDLFLAWLGKSLFVWQEGKESGIVKFLSELFYGDRYEVFEFKNKADEKK